MYQQTGYSQVWVSPDGERWRDWKGRQAYRYRYAGPRKAN